LYLIIGLKIKIWHKFNNRLTYCQLNNQKMSGIFKIFGGKSGSKQSAPTPAEAIQKYS
jgi:hypothetical protein